MILAASSDIPWLSISINILLVVFVVVCLLMTLVVLMQRPKQEGLGAAFGAGVTDQVFGARTTDVLQKATWFFTALFFILALTLSVLMSRKNMTASTLTAADHAPKKEAAAAPETPQPAPKSLAEDLPKEQPVPANPLTPGVPVEPITPVPTPAPEAAPTPVPAPAAAENPPAAPAGQ